MPAFGAGIPLKKMYPGGTSGMASPKASPLASQYSALTNAQNSNNSIYNGLVSNYQDLYNKTNQNTPTNITLDPYSYKPFEYTPSKDYTNALNSLNEFSKTGGYSDSDIYNLRERAISPIRSVYANAQRDVDRNRSLQGGYSPSYNALKAKMAREQSQLQSDAVTKANAEIADKQVAGKKDALSQIAQLTSGENQLRNQFGSQETTRANEFGMKNTDLANQNKTLSFQLPMQKSDQLMKILEGIRGVYGTTPALTNLYGNQAQQGASLQNNIIQSNRSSALNKILGMIGQG